MEIFELGKNHSHETHEEKRQCVLSFGKCWYIQDKPAKDKRISNKPSGAYAKDRNFNQ